MTVTFRCPCGRMLQAPDAMVGQRARCVGCGQILLVPATRVAAAPAPPSVSVPPPAPPTTAPRSAIPQAPMPMPPAPPRPAVAQAPAPARPDALQAPAAAPSRSAVPQPPAPAAPPRAAPAPAAATAPPGSLCAICQTAIAAHEPRTACSACKADYHTDCWTDNQGCAVYGCSEVPATEHRDVSEIPVSYWGQENKPCPSCGQEILAAAVRCRFCGATFASARPEDTYEFQQRSATLRKLPLLRRSLIWLFICSIIPCLAPFAALFGIFFYAFNRDELKALPALYSALGILALVVSLGQTLFLATMVFMFGSFR